MTFFMSRKNKFIAFVLIAGILGVGALRAYNFSRPHAVKQVRFMMNTYVTVIVRAPRRQALAAINLAFARMQEVSHKFSPYDPESPVYLFNHENVPISDEEVLKVVRVGLKISEETSGAFDMTVQPLVNLWGFSTASAPPRLPSDDEIRETLKRVGYRHLSFQNGRLVKDDPLIEIVLAPLAKGYAVGEAIKVLKEKGITSAVVAGGGDVYVLGKNGKEYWRVGLKNPLAEGMLGYLEVEDAAVMGSGDYERFVIIGGKRYHHIFDPRTGYPAQECHGTFVIYSDPMLADAWATALFVMGPEQGLKTIAKIPSMEAIAVTQKGDLFVSAGLKGTLEELASKKRG